MLSKIYLYIHYTYIILCNFILRCLGPVYNICHFDVDADVKKNITLSSYVSFFNKENSKKSIYWIKIYHLNGPYYLAYHGSRNHLNKLTCGKIIPELSSKRKNVMLMNKGKPVNFDLNLLDNYKRTAIQNQLCFIDKCDENSYTMVTKLNTILKLFECDATDVQIINLMPFKKEIISIDDDCSIDILYK